MNLQKIAQEAALKLHHLMMEAEHDMENCFNEVINEAEGHEEPAKFRIGFTITLDTDEDVMTCTLSYAVRRKLKSEQPIPDGSQPELPLQPPQERPTPPEPHFKAGETEPTIVGAI